MYKNLNLYDCNEVMHSVYIHAITLIHVAVYSEHKYLDLQSLWIIYAWFPIKFHFTF